MGKCCSKFFEGSNNNISKLRNSLNKTDVDKAFANSFLHSPNKSKGRDRSTLGKNKKLVKIDVSRKDFLEIKTIGRGSFGKVILVKYINDDNLYAMKILSKDSIIANDQVIHIKTERIILERVENPFIVKLKFAFQTTDKLYLVTEFMQGGELFYHLHNQGRFSEKRAKFYACEMILALEYLHQSKIIYRDIKPENILLDNEGHIKLTDFGLSKFCFDNSDQQKTFTICGTPEYIAPEILKGNGYDKNVDWWGLGCLIYEMISGRSPFKHLVQNKLDIGIYSDLIEYNKYFSDSAIDLISKLLQVDVEKRLGYGPRDAEMIKSHKFFEGVDWRKVYDKYYDTPFTPKLKNSNDLDYFDKIFTEESLKDTPIRNPSLLQKNDGIQYGDFSYVCDDTPDIHLRD